MPIIIKKFGAYFFFNALDFQLYGLSNVCNIEQKENVDVVFSVLGQYNLKK